MSQDITNRLGMDMYRFCFIAARHTYAVAAPDIGDGASPTGGVA